MFVRVSVYEIPGHRMDEAVKGFREALDEIRDMGLQEAYVLVSPESDRLLTLTFWERAEDMESSRLKASRLRSEAAKVVDGGVQSVTEYEVAAHENFGS
jgi:heme-degrading monooxygenase HmoA